MSCRGRAEAFARSLQSRLRTLGSQVDDHSENEVVNSTDTSWVNNNNINTTTIIDTQPPNGPTSITETADSYFDFDMEPESPGSPVDECEYTRLIETSGSTPQEQAPESGFVCASPSSTNGGGSLESASSSEVQFFDPESSDTGTEFFDCPTEHKSPRRYRFLSHNRVAMKPSSPITASSEPSSSESSTTPTKVNGHIRLLESGEFDSSDSFPPSQLSTNSSLSNTSKFNSNSNSNSTLQDADGAIVNDEIQSEGQNDDGTEKFTSSLYEVSKAKFVKYISTDIEDVEHEEEQKPDLECEIEAVSEEVFDQDKVLEEITTIDSKETLPEAESVKKESDGEEYERVPRIRRCSSLKTGKTPPGTPGRKKIVRFADVLGLDLADVRTFLDEVPKIPKSAYEYLDLTMPSQEIQLGPALEKVLVPMFQQPGCLPGFFDRLRENQVCLESAAVTDPITLTITGCVRVRNLDFHKSVHVRYSMDNWHSHSDLTASYVEGSCDGFSDKFSFILFGNSLQIGQRVELAIRFQAKGEQFWDSNYGTNYAFQCLPCSARTINIIETPIEVNLLPDNISEMNLQAVTTLTDAMGSQQWSNTFLY